MIPIHSNFQKLDLVALFNLQANRLHNSVHLLIKHGSPICCGENKMVQQDGNIMTSVYIFAHSPMLRRKRRGIHPQPRLNQKQQQLKNLALLS